jgi:hypothetical protein
MVHEVAMIRTQIQFTEEQMAALRRLARGRGRPVAEIVRQCVDALLAGTTDLSPDEKWRRAGEAVGGFRSGRTDVAAEHDRYLAEAIEAESR